MLWEQISALAATLVAINVKCAVMGSNIWVMRSMFWDIRGIIHILDGRQEYFGSKVGDGGSFQIWSAWGAHIPPPFTDQIFARKQVTDHGKTSQRRAKYGVYGPTASKKTTKGSNWIKWANKFVY